MSHTASALAGSASNGRVPLALDPPRRPLVHPAHKIAAGFPSPAQDYLEPGLDLNEYLVDHKAASFLFTVQGESMSGAGIMDGDKVVVDRSVQARHGDIVIAVLDAEYTLKRLYSMGGTIELRPENPAFAALLVSEGSTLEIWGVVVASIRKYRR